MQRIPLLTCMPVSTFTSREADTPDRYIVHASLYEARCLIVAVSHSPVTVWPIASMLTATYWWEQHQDLPMDGEAKPYRSFGGYPGTDGWQLFDRVLDGSCFKDFSGCLRHVLSEVSRHHPADLLVWTEKAIAAWHVLVHNMTVLHDWGRNTGTPGEAVR